VIYDERRHKLVSDLYKRQTVFDFERAVSGEDFGGVLREKKRKKEKKKTRGQQEKKKWKNKLHRFSTTSGWYLTKEVQAQDYIKR